MFKLTIRQLTILSSSGIKNCGMFFLTVRCAMWGGRLGNMEKFGSCCEKNPKNNVYHTRPSTVVPIMYKYIINIKSIPFPNPYQPQYF